MNYQTIELSEQKIGKNYAIVNPVPMEGALGAEINGLDLSQPLDKATVAEIHQALLEYQVLCFRGQNLSLDQELAFAQYFGEIDTYPFAKPIDGYPTIVAVTKEPGTHNNFGGVWHTDSPYQANPPKATILYGVDIPKSGGDTMFANLYAAYDALSDGMKQLIEQIKGTYSAACVHASKGLRIGDIVRIHDDEVIDRLENLHPIVRTHPETGRKVLFISRVHINNFENMTMDESKPLLDFLAEHAAQPQFTMRLRWSVGTVVICDNRCVTHIALNDYPDERREIHRIVLKGDRPF
jgi:taurine dioxygenase